MTVAVAPATRRALERMGLLKSGYDRDREALILAVERFLGTATAVQAIGDALYSDDAEFAGLEERTPSDRSSSRENRGGNATYP